MAEVSMIQSEGLPLPSFGKVDNEGEMGCKARRNEKRLWRIIVKGVWAARACGTSEFEKEDPCSLLTPNR